MGDYVVTIDCDLSYGPEHIGRLVTELRSTNAKIVIASPYAKNGQTTKIPFMRRFLSRSANRFLAATARGHLSTLTGMVRAYDRRFLSTLNLRSMGTDINTEILYKAELLGAKVVEIPAHLDWTFSQSNGKRRRSLNQRLRTAPTATCSPGSCSARSCSSSVPVSSCSRLPSTRLAGWSTTSSTTTFSRRAAA